MVNIESVKRKIAYHAQFIGLRFDSDDIFHVNTSPENVLVALARHYTYEEPESDGVPIKVYHNLLWFEYPPNAYHTTYEGNTSCTIIDIPLPTLMIQVPSLVCWIRNGEMVKMDKSIAWDELKEEISQGYVAEFNDLVTGLLNEHLNHSTS